MFDLRSWGGRTCIDQGDTGPGNEDDGTINQEILERQEQRADDEVRAEIEVWTKIESTLTTTDILSGRGLHYCRYTPGR